MVDEVPDHNIIINEYPNTNLPIVKLNNDLNRLFFRHWEIKMIFPTMVFILLISGISIYFICIHPYILSTTWKIFCVINIFISLAMFLWSYISAMCMDPGFLPYDWFTTQKTKYTWREQLEGLAITREQHDYATSHPRPAGSCFSHSYGRLVLRPDHICGWIANWVGKRNHKQFILMMLYGSLFASSLAWPRLLIKSSIAHVSDSFDSLGQLAIVIECIFTVGLLSGFISQICDLKFNLTHLDKLKAKKSFKDPDAIKYRSGFYDVCGHKSKCLWAIPTPAFDDIIPFDIEDPNQVKQQTQSLVLIQFQNVPILDEDDIL